MAGSKSEAEYLKMLQKVSAEVKEIWFQKSQSSEKVVYENTDGVEVFEVNDNNQSKWVSEIFNESTISQPGDKVRPNDPCPCGSGKKYKKCCGAK
jgi:uncharacterized protein YchJ